MFSAGLGQIYTGDGKGKTTAAFGLALRAAGRGSRVFIYQFLKPVSLQLGERIALKRTDLDITIEASQNPWDMAKSLNDAHAVAETKEEISRVMGKITRSAQKKIYDMIILDEIVFCLSKQLADLTDIKNLIQKRDKAVEIIMTGRGASDELIALAALVTRMKIIKHPFEKSIDAREGIEF